MVLHVTESMSVGVSWAAVRKRASTYMYMTYDMLQTRREHNIFKKKGSKRGQEEREGQEERRGRRRERREEREGIEHV